MQFRTIEQSGLASGAEGLQFITVKSEALVGRGIVTVYSSANLSSDHSPPVFILLHGVYGSHWSWALQGKAHTALESLIQDHKLPPAILVMPSDGMWGDGSGYANHSGKRFEDWIALEVPQLIRKVYPQVDNDSRFCIGGLSMGGYGALRVGLKHSIFEAISCHSSMTSLAQMSAMVEEDWNPILRSIPDVSVQDIISSVSKIESRIRLDCGIDDELIDVNRELHNFMIQNGLEHIYEEYPGGHTWEYWHEHVRQTFEFFYDVV